MYLLIENMIAKALDNSSLHFAEPKLKNVALDIATTMHDVLPPDLIPESIKFIINNDNANEVHHYFLFSWTIKRIIDDTEPDPNIRIRGPRVPRIDPISRMGTIDLAVYNTKADKTQVSIRMLSGEIVNDLGDGIRIESFGTLNQIELMQLFVSCVPQSTLLIQEKRKKWKPFHKLYIDLYTHLYNKHQWAFKLEPFFNDIQWQEWENENV